MRTFPGLKLSIFTPEQRDQLKIVDDMLRQVSGGLARSIQTGQSPAANPIPSLSNPTGPPPQSGTPVATAGDLLYGLSGGSWAKLPIGTPGHVLTALATAPAWGAVSVDFARTWSTLQTFKDTTFKLVDDGDATKTTVFSLGGASAGADLTIAWVGTADRTLSMPDVTGSLQTVTGYPSFGFDSFGQIDASVITKPLGLSGVLVVSNVALTSGRVPFASTGGILINDADLTFATDTLTATKMVGTTSVKVGTAAGYISSDGSTGATGSFTSVDSKTMTVKDGIITSIV
jgi:hypothetical protein